MRCGQGRKRSRQPLKVGRMGIGLLMLLAACRLAPVACAAEPPGETAGKLRRPVALGVLDGRVWVAQGRSGELTVLDDRFRVAAEFPVAARLADMVVARTRRQIYVIDAAQHRVLSITAPRLGECAPPLPASPLVALPGPSVRLALSPSEQILVASSVWARSITLVHWRSERQPPTSWIVRLPFSPRAIVFLGSDRWLLAADAFGGKLAVIDLRGKQPLRQFSLRGHNIRALALSGDGRQVYVTHQRLDPVGRTEFDDVHWGTFVQNVYHVLQTKALLSRETAPTEGSWVEKLGRTGRAAGDPGPIWTGRDGALAVASSGVGDLFITQTSYAQRLRVGRRPIAMTKVGSQLFVANQMDDTLSRVDLASGQLQQTIAFGPAPPITPRDRGERLFFDARLAHDGWMSCHSCHAEGHTIGARVDTLGDGDYGAPKRVPSLLGTEGTGPWAWDGSMPTLEAQIRKSVRKTMHGHPLGEQQVQDLAAYLRSLKPPPPAQPTPDRQTLRAGRRVFETRGCAKCHQGRRHTTSGVFHVGLKDENGRSAFNPPSLRGVGQRAPLFHDGRAANLDAVLDRFRHQLGNQPLGARARATLLAYLRSL